MDALWMCQFLIFFQVIEIHFLVDFYVFTEYVIPTTFFFFEEVCSGHQYLVETHTFYGKNKDTMNKNHIRIADALVSMREI